MKSVGKFTLEHRFFMTFLIFLLLSCVVLGFAFLVDLVNLDAWIAFLVGGLIFAMAFLFFSSVIYYFFEKEEDQKELEDPADEK